MTNTKTWAAKRFLGLAGLCGLLAGLAGQPAGLSVANTSRYIGNGRWEWTIFIKGPAAEVQQISRVEYILPPSFPRPVRTVEGVGNAETPFALTERGWGTFPVTVRIRFSDGRSQLLRYRLVLESRPVWQGLDLRPGHSVNPLNPREWRIFITGRPDVLDRVLLVRYSIPSPPGEIAPNSEYEVLDRGAGARCFELTGVSSAGLTVGVRVFLRDGAYQDLPNHRIDIAIH